MTRVRSRRLDLPATTAQLERLAAFLHEACADHPNPVLIELAATESVVNAIEHGAAARCRIEVERLAASYRVTLEDDGAAFDPLAAPALPLGEAREHGYGVAILHTVPTRSRYRRQGGWNRLELCFALTPAGAGQD